MWLSVVAFTACEQEYIPVNPQGGPKYVVEGYIEAGQNPFPPYVLLTRTLDFYGEIGPDQFNESFVHDADVRVHDGTMEVQLQEVCFSSLDPVLQEIVAEQFGFDADSLTIDFCVYIDLQGQLQPQIGKTYQLLIRVGQDSITATTMIPRHVPLENIFFAPPPGEPNDTLAQLRAFVSDPPGERNFYRYLSATNGGQLETAFSSVEEDLFFDGKAFEFQLFNPATDGGDIEPDEFGLYFVGDTIDLKWCSIDEAQFDFWNTLEFSNANQGPFSGYTRLQSNIHGGLGIWGGCSVSYYTLVVEY
jgi:hypothetical protein